MFTIMTPAPPTPTRPFSFPHTPGRARLDNYRPQVSSPLSSSPVRAASSPGIPGLQSPPHSPRGRRHGTQSSPLFPSISTSTNTGSGSGSGNDKKFRFATRNPRPNPVVKRREDAQEGRRRLFLQNVRHRADEKKWERRGGEDEVLKLEWWRLNRERQLAREREARFLAAEQGEEEDDAEALDVDALMVDQIEQQEQAEVEALVSVLEEAGPAPPHFSDDEEYDGLFMDLVSQQQLQQQRQQQQQPPPPTRGEWTAGDCQDVEMS